MTEQAAQDSNMPPIDEPETEQTEELEQAETAPATVDENEGQFVNDVSEKTQKRINKITAEKYAEKRRADELERQYQELKTSSLQTSQPTNEPKLEDFDYDETAFNSALIDFKVNLKANEIQQQQQQARAQESVKQQENDFHLKVAAFIEKAPDYEQVVANIPQLPEQTFQAVMQSDKGAELAYYLGKHLDVADEIANADPVMAAMKLGQISAQMTAPIKTASAAPDPIAPVGSGGVSNKDPEEMSMEEIYNM